MLGELVSFVYPEIVFVFLFGFLLLYDWVLGDETYFERSVDYREQIDRALEDDELEEMNELMKKQSISGSGFKWLRIFGMPVLIFTGFWIMNLDFWFMVKSILPIGVFIGVSRNIYRIKNFVFTIT